MNSQLFKKKYPKENLFLLLDKYCEKYSNYYKLSKSTIILLNISILQEMILIKT